jgi:Zn-dependent M28 family amino/carboxypeptidase
MDEELFSCGSDPVGAAHLAGVAVRRVFQGLDEERLRLVHGLRPAEAEQLDMRVLSSGGRFTLVELDEAAEVVAEPSDALGAAWIVDVPHDVVLARQLANDPVHLTKALDPRIAALADEVDGDRWFADVTALASMNRFTHSTGILGARDWLVDQLDALPGLVVTTQSFPVNGSTGYNVIAALSGSSRPDDWYLIGGHYDAVSEDPDWAPGAEDNASGCAGVLEMARVFSSSPPEATMVFICFSGEEQGLVGSNAHAASLVQSGDDAKVRAVLNMDMIGYTADSDLDCLLETRSVGQSFMDTLAGAATNVTSLRIVTSLFAWGSDHVPYLNGDMAAVLTIENDYASYPGYHSTTDLPQNITIEMGRQVLRMNVAALAELAGVASADVLFSDGFESGDSTAWSATAP